MTKPADSTPAIGLSVSHQIAEDRNVVAQLFVPMDCPAADLNAALDKVFRATDRQKARIRLPQAKLDLARLDKAYTRANEDLVRLDLENGIADREAASAHTSGGRRGEFKLNSSQIAAANKNRADRENVLVSIKRGTNDMDSLRVEIGALEALIAAED